MGNRGKTDTCFTSESVTMGHPDKLCDQIADAVLDDILRHDANALVDCDVTACRDGVHIMGEVASDYSADYEGIAREVLRFVGYSEPSAKFNAETCIVRVNVHDESPDIICSVERSASEDAGACDQGTVFGFACDDTSSLMPMPITLAHTLTRRLDRIRRDHPKSRLLPDGKAQVSVEYRNGCPLRIAAIVLSAQNDSAEGIDSVRERLAASVVRAVLPQSLIDNQTLIYINPTGRFILGGPFASSGLTGRKTLVDTYGGFARCGGSSLAGKDPSKINRSGAYMARYLAKNIVAAHLARKCEIRLSYAMGLTDPVCISVDTMNTAVISDDRLTDWIVRNIDLRPSKITERLNLRRPIYRALSCYGQVGENALSLPWEKTDLVGILSADLG